MPNLPKHIDSWRHALLDLKDRTVQKPDDLASVDIVLDGRAGARVIRLDETTSAEIVQRVDGKTLRTDRGGELARPLVDQVVGTSAFIARGLSRGRVFQIVGPPAVVEGLRVGTYEMIPSGNGVLGTVRQVNGKKMTGPDPVP